MSVIARQHAAQTLTDTGFGHISITASARKMALKNTLNNSKNSNLWRIGAILWRIDGHYPRHANSVRSFAPGAKTIRSTPLSSTAVRYLWRIDLVLWRINGAGMRHARRVSAPAYRMLAPHACMSAANARFQWIQVTVKIECTQALFL